MTPTWSIRCLRALDAAQIEGLVGVLIDCVEGGAWNLFQTEDGRVETPRANEVRDADVHVMDAFDDRHDGWSNARRSRCYNARRRLSSQP